MKGIYLINENCILDNFTKEESIALQKKAGAIYLKENHISPIKLNPYQINDYYTIPHALLYDLKHSKVHIDCLVAYSEKILDDFIHSYPARWLVLKSYFDQVLFVDQDKEKRKKPAI